MRKVAVRLTTNGLLVLAAAAVVAYTGWPSPLTAYALTALAIGYVHSGFIAHNNKGE